MATQTPRRPVRPTALPATASMMVVVLLATCAAVAAEAQCRSRDGRVREGWVHSSGLGLVQVSGAFVFAESAAGDPEDAGPDPRISDAGGATSPGAGEGGFGGSAAGERLRRVLNTPPPVA